MKVLFSVAAVVQALLGVLWLLVPQAMLSGWGTPNPDAITVYVARRQGALFFGTRPCYGLQGQALRRPHVRPYFAGSAVVAVVIAVVSVVGVMTGVVGPAVWSAALVEAMLATGFVYYYLATRS